MKNEIHCQVTQVNEVCLQADFHFNESNHSHIQHVNPSLCLAINACKEKLLSAFPYCISDIVIAYKNMLIYFDLMQVDSEAFSKEIEQVCQRTLQIEDFSTSQTNTTEIPVFYGDRCGPDLTRVAQMNAITEQDVIEQHCAQTYWVYALGFIPGFTYLGFVDNSIATPRLNTPRKSVPTGSVGIADTQTGAYPSASPGGWNIIGRTPISLLEYNDEKQLHTPRLSVADQVRFKPINEAEFLELGGSLDEGFIE